MRFGVEILKYFSEKNLEMFFTLHLNFFLWHSLCETEGRKRGENPTESFSATISSCYHNLLIRPARCACGLARCKGSLRTARMSWPHHTRKNYDQAKKEEISCAAKLFFQLKIYNDATDKNRRISWIFREIGLFFVLVNFNNKVDFFTQTRAAFYEVMAENKKVL